MLASCTPERLAIQSADLCLLLSQGRPTGSSRTIFNDLRTETPPNKSGRDFTVGDIHGSFSLLEKAFDAAEFDPDRDRLFCVGDLVNRGTESRRSLEFLEKSWFFSLRGNHDNDVARHVAHMNLKGRAAVRDEFTRAGRDWMLKLMPEKQAIYSRGLGSLPFAIEIPGIR